MVGGALVPHHLSDRSCRQWCGAQHAIIDAWEMDGSGKISLTLLSGLIRRPAGSLGGTPTYPARLLTAILFLCLCQCNLGLQGECLLSCHVINGFLSLVAKTCLR